MHQAEVMKHIPTLWLAALAVASCLVIAACSSSDETATTVAVDPTATDAPAASTTTSELPVSEPPVSEPPGSEVLPLTEADRLGSYVLADETFGTMVEVTVEAGMRTIVSNALPDHETGEFPNDGNPNEITAQDLSWSYTTTPVLSDNPTEVRTTGVAVNGVKFEPGTGESVSCTSGGNYRIEALQDMHDLGLDFNNAHVQPGGEYHYHGISEMLVEAYASDEDLVHVGFAADGFLMYHSKSDAYTTSYELSTTERAGEGCTATGPGDVEVEIDGTVPDGTYSSDWVFSEGLGDLDRCNGITIGDQYVYIVTDTYPFVGRCLYGEVEGRNAPPRP